MADAKGSAALGSPGTASLRSPTQGWESEGFGRSLGMVEAYGSGRKAEASEMQCLALMCNRVDGPSKPMSAVVALCFRA